MMNLVKKSKLKQITGQQIKSGCLVQEHGPLKLLVNPVLGYLDNITIWVNKRFVKSFNLFIEMNAIGINATSKISSNF